MQVKVMSCCSKEKMERNDCVNSIKSQLNKSEREAYRICPSKLSKRELEDLYFTLLESNLELKKTVHKQQDNIRVLSTQVQRMTSNQEKLVNKEMNKECCIGTKTFVNDQKACITELKEANRRMSDRIEQLTRRLSSAKQFQKTTLLQPATARQNPFRVTSAPPKKHDGLSKVQETFHPPDTPLKFSTYSQLEDKSPKKSTQTQITVPVERSPKSDETCDGNKCRSLIDELKLKTVTLQEELSMVHFEYSTRIGRLENEVAEVRKENGRVSSERTASQHDLQNTLKQNSDILAEFRKSEAKCAELAAELSIEKRKVAELDTLLKAASLSDRVNKTMEEHLITQTSRTKQCCPSEAASTCCYPELPVVDNDKNNSLRGARARCSPTKEIEDIKVKLQSKTADDTARSCCDSGEMALLKQNKHLLGKILELQNKLDSMKKGVGESPEGKLSSPTSVDSPPLLEQFAEIDMRLSTRSARTRFSPSTDKYDTNTADDSGYQDSDETALQTMNRELLLKISELQNRIDCMKIGVSQMFEAQSGKLRACEETQTKSTDTTVATELNIPPSLSAEFTKTDKRLSTRFARTRFSPTTDKDYTKSTNTADDSGYQESDETALQTMNRELLLKISELQNQIDCMKLGASESSETKVVKSSSVNCSAALVDSPPTPQFQLEDNTLPFPSRPSDERINPQKLRIEVLGNPTDSNQKIVQHDPLIETRAKTIQRRNGTLEHSDERSTSTCDEYNNIVNFDSTIDYENRKLTITENNLEVADSNQPDTVASKFSIETGLVLNPEKLKYLDNEGIITEENLENIPSKLKVDVVSIAESVPSNPELGFSIPRLAYKEKKGQIDSGRAKTSLTADLSPQRVRNNNLEIFPGKLKLATTETLAVNYPTATKQTDDTKEKEDCEYCAACSFDKECKIKHENALNPPTTTLTHGVQKEQNENRDLLNTLQVADAITTSHYSKKEKKKNLFCHFMKDMNRKQKTRNLSQDEMLASQKDTQKAINTASQPKNPPNQRENSTTNNFLQPGHIQDSILVAKIKKIKSAQKQKKDDDLIEGSTSYASHTCRSGVRPNIMPDVPLLGNEKNRKLVNDTIGIEENDNLQIPIVEIKMPTEEARLVESTADVSQNPEFNFNEKASEAITTKTNKADARRLRTREFTQRLDRDVNTYQRSSGTISFRSVPVCQDRPACDCPEGVDGCCTNQARNKGVQKDGDEPKQLASPRDRRRQPSVIQRETYTVDSHRADTPDTDREMTYLPDLPLENEKRSPGRVRPLSPGEDRTTTQTSSLQSDYSRHTTARSSLSEGEMPCTSKRRSSIVIDKPYLNPALPHKQETTPVHQMETAMNAISAQLQRCKHLLHANRSDEVTRLSTVML